MTRYFQIPLLLLEISRTYTTKFFCHVFLIFTNFFSFSGTLTLVSAKVICQEFARAHAKLKQGREFKWLLDPNDRVPRPFDTKSMDY